MAFENYWNETHKKYSINKPTYDDWLDKYSLILNKCKSPVLDLGCGLGNDTLYLVKKGFSVIACDYSNVALEQVNQNIKDVKTIQLDISLPLPFEDNSFDLIIADLSLHYFDEKATINIMKEIKRILKPNGNLLARVNSTSDLNYGAGKGEKLEDNYYFVEGYNKRFFSISDANRFFSIIGKVSVVEAEMLRYTKPKKVIEVNVEKKCNKTKNNK